MIDSTRDVAYRLTAIHIATALTWVALAVYTWFLVARTDIDVASRAAPLVIGYAVALALIFVPWRDMLARLYGDIVLLTWLSSFVLAAVALPELQDPATSTFLLLGAAAFATAVTSAWPANVAAILITLLGFISVEVSRNPAAGIADTARLAGFSATLLLIALGQVVVTRRVSTADARLTAAARAEAQLEARAAELEQVFAVSRTIGTGRALDEVLPDLVGRVVGAVGANSGAVLLLDDEEDELRLISPLWTTGLPLPADGVRLTRSGAGLAQDALRRGSPIVRSAPDVDPADRLLSALGESAYVALPLRAGAEVIGVLVVGDTREQPFTPHDVETMESLAGPAALVLNQLARYEEARAMSERMSELARLKTDFVSVVSHELRTPLTSIIGSLRTLQRPQLAPRDPDGRVLLDTAARQANRLKALIEDLLVVSRIDNRALPVRPERLDLRATINDIVDSIPGAAQYTTVDVADEASEVTMDPEHLRRILINLVENSLHYAPRTQVRVEATREKGEAVIRVIDHGPGIPAQYVDTIFERFVQVGRRSEEGRGGTGLGLSIVRGLAEAMGGRVWYEHRAYDVGAVFAVAIPLRAGSLRTAEL
jgi:signal transduction histidine kinase